MEEVKIIGEVESVIFQNTENGYAVFSLETEDDEVTCVGTVPQLHQGETLEIHGTWTVHPLYGRQIQVQYYEKSMPTTVSGIEKYLSSGLIKGIGPKTAKKIVAEFGEASFYVIEEKPEELAKIRGLTYEKAQRISDVFREQHELRKAMLFLQDFDISPTYAMKIYKKYKSRTFDIVKTNPYRLADDIWGIGFRMADKMAASAGIQPDDANRVKAAVKYVLTTGAGNGDCFLPKEQLLEEATKLLELHPMYVENALRELQVDSQIWQETIDGVEAVYLNFYFYAEMAVAKRLLELLAGKKKINLQNAEEIVLQTEKETGVKLAQEQRTAVMQALEQGVLIITGGPGTGKTTTINTILRILQDEERDVILAAPTGRAAKRMTEATGVEAKTIHRLLETTFLSEDSRRQTFERNEENPLEADVIIVDEASMIDLLLMHSFLRAVAPKTRVIFVGDVDQLPSVGAGNVLRDMIASGKLPVVRLQHIFRQAQESAIIMNAHRINRGEQPILNGKDTDFFFVKRAFGEDVVTAIRDLVTKRLPRFTGCDGLRDMQVLTPMRKGVLGVQNLNGVLQEALNPPNPKRVEKEYRQIVFREGDKVMQIKNNYNIAWRMYNSMGKCCEEGVGVFNGDAGRIRNIDDSAETMEVLFDDGKVVEYDYSQLEELELAYAITIHKSQGSEYPVVVLPVHSGPPMLLTRNLLYTAVTRAKSMVVLVGLQETISAMIARDKEVRRDTGLSQRIRSLYDFMEGTEG